MNDFIVQARPITEADLPALLEIYASTRAEELALVPAWSEEQKRAFVEQQFYAQHKYYREFYVGADLQLLEANHTAIGRLYVHWNYSATEVRIMDIAILPPYRGHGLGSQLLQAVIQKGTELGKSTTIHVECNNPALRLYERLGFVKIGEFNTYYYLMEWKPKNGIS